MEEQEIIRKNQFINFPIDVFCVKIDNGYRIITYSPLDNLLTCRVIKEKGVPFSEHPLLRPFDRFLLEGDPKIGKVTHIFILDQQTNLSAIAFSIVETSRSFLILPAWGRGLMKPLSNQDVKELSPIAHITIVKDAKGNYKIHYTESSVKKKGMEQNYPKNKLNMKDEHSLHIGALGVNELKALDPRGILYRDLKGEELRPVQRFDIEKLEQILQDALSQNHRLYKLPPEHNWDNEHHLEISFALSRSELENITYLKDEIVPHEIGAIEQINMIRLDNEANLLFTFTMCPDKFNNTFKWKRSAGQNNPIENQNRG